MKKNALVSVIIPAYNCGQYLEECILSLQQQTYKNIEIIICDDCSSDNTYDVMTKLKQKYNNVFILKNDTNMKAGATRNNCINICHGDFILLQDADDYSQSNRIEKLIDVFDKNSDIDYVSSGMNKFDERGIWSKLSFVERKISKYDIVKGCPVAHAATMFKKEALESVGGYRISRETVRLEDYDLFYRLYLNGKNGYVISDLLYNYREDQHAFKRKKYIYRIDEFKIRKKYFKDMKVKFYYYIYVVKPLVIGLIPLPLLRCINKIRGDLIR